jgi:hypothetical protein
VAGSPRGLAPQGRKSSLGSSLPEIRLYYISLPGRGKLADSAAADSGFANASDEKFAIANDGFFAANHLSFSKSSRKDDLGCTEIKLFLIRISTKLALFLYCFGIAFVFRPVL